MTIQSRIARIRYTLAALALGLIGLILLTGCAPGSSPLASSGPSSLSGGSGTFGPLDTNLPNPINLPPLGGIGLSCPSDAPAPVRANAQGQLRPDGRDAVLIDWRAVSGRVYQVEVDRFEVTNAYAPAVRFNTETNQDTRAYGPGRYRARVRSRAAGLCAEPGNWSVYVLFSVEPGVERTPAPPEPPPVCEAFTSSDESAPVCED